MNVPSWAKDYADNELAGKWYEGEERSRQVGVLVNYIDFVISCELLSPAAFLKAWEDLRQPMKELYQEYGSPTITQHDSRKDLVKLSDEHADLVGDLVVRSSWFKIDFPEELAVVLEGLPMVAAVAFFTEVQNRKTI